MSKQEVAWIGLAICFAVLAIMFLIFYLVGWFNAAKKNKVLLSIFVIFLVVAIGCGIKFYSTVYMCKSCGEQATYKTPFGRYCDNCFDEKMNKECCRCGKTIQSYVSKGGKYYCHNCATVEFGLEYYGYGQ